MNPAQRWSHIRIVIAIVAALMCATGCARGTGAAPVPAPSATTPVTGAPNADAAVPASVPPVRTATLQAVQAPWPSTVRQSRVRDDVPPVDGMSIHRYRSQDPQAPAIAVVGPGHIWAERHAELAAPLQVQSEPGALVVLRATQLGTFSNGRADIAVQADADGIARIPFKTGLDAGDYPILAVSPARTGILEFHVFAKTE